MADPNRWHIINVTFQVSVFNHRTLHSPTSDGNVSLRTRFVHAAQLAFLSSGRGRNRRGRHDVGVRCEP